MNFFALFNWKLLKIGILQVGEFSPAPSTPPVIRVVLIHIEQIVQRHNSSTVFPINFVTIKFFDSKESIVFDYG